MKRIILLCGMAWASAAFGLEWFTYNVNEAIPDNSGIGMQNTQAVSGFSNTIVSVQVRLRIDAAPADAAFNGDYYVSLQHSSGFAILMNRPGRASTNTLGYGDNGFDVVFVAGDDDIHRYREFAYGLDGNGALTGSWGADGRNVDPDVVLDTDSRTAGLDSFNGQDANGNWTLFVADVNANGNGVLHSWGLQIEVIPEPTVLVLLAAGLGNILLLLRARARCRPRPQ